MDVNRIKHVVVDINDFLVVAEMKNGALHMVKNGGITMIARTAIGGDNKNLLKEFFNVIRGVESKVEYLDVEYFGIILPPILVEHLMDVSHSDNILRRINEHIDKNVGYWNRSGYKAIAKMSFASDEQPIYRRYNQQNLRLVEIMNKKGYNVHVLGNCSRASLDAIEVGHGKLPVISSTTSADIKHLKCASGKNCQIYDEWFSRRPTIKPEEVLFVEVQEGYAKSVNLSRARAQTILYRGQEQKADFIDEISERLGLKITLKDITS